METTFDDLGKALERNQHTPGASVAVVAVAVAIGLGIIVALVGASTSAPQVPHNVGLWGEQHAIG
ncbi:MULTISPECIES: hypothetical protein [Mesorhizobium]|jgi:hypothetical protein|uniref:Uncharacterized protein n=1 Tax=Rhizobium loti TaxID=381 RepID=A0A6M7U2G8_RHILI|nr:MULTISPECIES: hypothetical protein [Mesorhizobium]KRB22454.1 hypothetical protein ASE05_14650 [Mesorhizobium sp. Root172]OBQ62275.1 hypothetical protein A8145_21770 [Mesorhizobium loti]QKC71345.1 hypothetical protein EB815_21075 [Mesorhizobium loti]QKC90266.1 hypothetical protein EB230_19060 [Mesorhizobium sp. NZP2234]